MVILKCDKGHQNQNKYLLCPTATKQEALSESILQFKRQDADKLLGQNLKYSFNVIV